MLEIILIVSVIAIDQATKYCSELFLSPVGTTYAVISGVFHFTSAHNEGAAWGMLQGGKWFFLALTLIVCIFLSWLLVTHRNKMTVFSRLCLSFLLAGAVGNMIDRVILSYVRDMFDFCLINFPIFNVADSALTIGCVMLIFDAFYLKERSLFELKLRKEIPCDKHNEREDSNG